MNKLIFTVLVLASSLFTACSSTPAPVAQSQTSNGYSLTLSPDTLTAEMEQTGQGLFLNFGMNTYLCSLVSLVTPSGEVVPVMQGQHFADLNYAHGFRIDYTGLKPYKTYLLFRVDTSGRLAACFQNIHNLPSEQRVGISLDALEVDGETLTNLSTTVLLKG